ncbi:MAG TPA: CaiB/BaiF CoA-transferase family protein [Candidatus Dormibacteraeota bacterium]|nr:CaiB/BaiF CoA-transferase family protein [Candidatus Dormibacteraeota bacterium]
MSALQGIRVVEMAGLAPAPFCGMILADFGADVVRVDRVGAGSMDQLARGKRSIAVNLKSGDGVETVLRLIEKADVLLEPYRPGVMERLGLGPDVATARNPRLVYARLTGFGQDGPYANMAGHDTNYIAISGALSLIGRKGERPLPPVNLLGDFAGGGMLCALGISLALLERAHSGKGQIVDAAMVDGAAYLSTFVYKFRNSGMWRDERGTNMLDGGAPFYETYRARDGEYLSVGAIEPQFYAALLHGLGIDAATMPHQMDQSKWPETGARFAEIFATKTRAEWCAIFDGTDACVAPILNLGEVADHPHNVARRLLIPDAKGKLEPAPAPRLSRTPGDGGRPLPEVGEHTRAVLAEYGFPEADVARLIEAGAVA